MNIYRIVTCLVVRSLPRAVREQAFKRLLGWEVHESAKIGFSIIDAERVSLGPNARVGNFNVIRNMTRVELRDSSAITRFVWISSSMMLTRALKTDLAGCLIVGPHTGITSRHHIDCSGGVEIGGFTTLAGVRSVIFTHEINPAANCQTVLPVKIGDYCLIGSNTLITPGTRIPDRCQIGMGSVVHGQLPEPETLYAGSPARRIRAVDGPYFHRSVGRLEL